jgi:hypothetical protein
MSTGLFPKQRPWTREAAAALLDMSGKLPGFEAIGERQLDAAVALHQMLLTHGCAYLADEVGMGKTYVALAVVALFRHLQPGFRVLYLAPSQNVLRKWHERELPAFIRGNVRQPDMRVQGPAGLPPAASMACMHVDDWIKGAVTAPSVLDIFLPLSALSFRLTGNHPPGWAERVRGMAELAGTKVNLAGVRDKKTFKNRAADVVNRVISGYDLVVVDEAHLLKSGAGASASDRANFLARALGAGTVGGIRRFRAALLLSGTPFDRDLMQLVRQFELFASEKVSPAPHERVYELAERRRAGSDWSEIQKGLKPYMIRRVQKLKVGDSWLSRNQYRVERRAEAGITLAGRNDPEALRQRLFTAVVQKRLIEHLDGENEGRFPLAMFSSWEAYAPARKSLSTVCILPDEDDDALPVTGEVMDIGKDAVASQDARAIDGNLMEDVVGSYREMFSEEPPHPKLEGESERLGREAFREGHKQLVFVRRLKSVDDLYLRLNQAYDRWLSDYLTKEGMPGCPEALVAARRAASQSKTHTVPVNEVLVPTVIPDGFGGDGEEDQPTRGDTLFSWFFRGKLDEGGQNFLRTHGLPEPILLRERLRNQDRLESIIGELDWRSFVTKRYPALPVVSYADLAERASGLLGAASALGRHRRLQLAWAQLVAKRLPPHEARPFDYLQEYLKELQIASRPVRDHIDAGQAEILLKVPTIGLALYRNLLGRAVLPAWEKVWCWLTAEGCNEAKGELEAISRLRELDLQRELLFALLRLDHPFIDLYLGWLDAWHDKAEDAAEALVMRVVEVCARTEGFGTGSILRTLAEAWEQIVKTNFAELLKGADRVERAQWRRNIQQQLSPFAPVEWASGQNTDARSAIARRFRMPGYPMVLIATSVLQEGEDLHVCCNRVTHFGISGSPIGIEQKNGRVDRIGSLAQRGLQRGRTVDEAGIRVSFPHLSESLEWYQIRDLSQSINDYLRSMHQVGARTVQDDPSLVQVVANRTPIPPLLPHHLHSPFEPELMTGKGYVGVVEVEKRFAKAQHILYHANILLAEVAKEVNFEPEPGRPDCYVSEDLRARLSLHPAHMTGELTILASRCLEEYEFSNLLDGGDLSVGQLNLEAIHDLAADPRCKYGLVEADDGWQLHAHAACFARGKAKRGKAKLYRDEIYDLLVRIGIPLNYAPPVAAHDALVRVLSELITADECTEFKWKPGKDLTRQSVYCQGLRITLKLWKAWVVASRVIETEPTGDSANILGRTLIRNAASAGPDFIYTRSGRIEARMTHPIAYTGAAELCCILRELLAIPSNKL